MGNNENEFHNEPECTPASPFWMGFWSATFLLLVGFVVTSAIFDKENDNPPEDPIAVSCLEVIDDAIRECKEAADKEAQRQAKENQLNQETRNEMQSQLDYYADRLKSCAVCAAPAPEWKEITSTTIPTMVELLVIRRSPHNDTRFVDVALWDGKKWHPHSYVMKNDEAAPVEYWRELPELPYDPRK